MMDNSSRYITRKNAVTLLVVILVVSVIVLLVLLSRAGDEAALEAELRASFIQAHGEGATLIEMIRPNDLYLAYWEDDEHTHASLRIDGLWIEVAKVDKE